MKTKDKVQQVAPVDRARPRRTRAGHRATSTSEKTLADTIPATDAPEAANENIPTEHDLIARARNAFEAAKNTPAGQPEMEIQLL